MTQGWAVPGACAGAAHRSASRRSRPESARQSCAEPWTCPRTTAVTGALWTAAFSAGLLHASPAETLCKFARIRQTPISLTAAKHEAFESSRSLKSGHGCKDGGCYACIMHHTLPVFIIPGFCGDHDLTTLQQDTVQACSGRAPCPGRPASAALCAAQQRTRAHPWAAP